MSALESMAGPPLRLLALFSHEAKPLRLPRAPATALPFAVRRLQPPFAALGPHLADLGQPLTRQERIAAGQARGTSLLECSVDVPPGERLPSAVERIVALRELGATAIVLPAAYKILGPSALDGLLLFLDFDAAWRSLFLHTFVIEHEPTSNLR